jgi:hypothetical protein
MTDLPIENYRAALDEIFPIDLPYCALRLAPPGGRCEEMASGALGDAVWMKLHYELFDANPSGGSRILRRREEFTELIVRGEEITSEPARVEPYLRGWAAAMRERLSLSYGLHFLQSFTLGGDCLRNLRGARTADEFRRALLIKNRREWFIPGVPKTKTEVDAALGTGPLAPEEIRGLLGAFAIQIAGYHRLALSNVAEPITWNRTGVFLELTLGRYARLNPSSKRYKPVSTRSAKVLFLPRAALSNRRRVIAYLSGWLNALDVLLEESYQRPDAKGKWSNLKFDLSERTPEDLVDPGVLSNPGLSTSREFHQALLSPTSLGRWMKPSHV